MRIKVTIISILFLTVFLSDFHLGEKIKTNNDTAFAAENFPVYQIPLETDEKRRRIGGSKVVSHRGLTRGLGTSLSNKLAGALSSVKNDTAAVKKAEISKKAPEYIAPIAPEHTGLTLSAQPVIYFFIAPEWADKIEFTLNREKFLTPVLRTDIDYHSETGILSIDLKKYNIKLRPDVEYEWFISVMMNPEDRTSKIFGSATIKHIKPSAAITEQIQKTAKEKLPYLYAEKGYFYDAIESLGRLIKTEKGKNYKIQRAALLEQVGLNFAAQYNM